MPPHTQKLFLNRKATENKSQHQQLHKTSRHVNVIFQNVSRKRKTTFHIVIPSHPPLSDTLRKMPLGFAQEAQTSWDCGTRLLL